MFKYIFLNYAPHLIYTVKRMSKHHQHFLTAFWKTKVWKSVVLSHQSVNSPASSSAQIARSILMELFVIDLHQIVLIHFRFGLVVDFKDLIELITCILW